MKFTNLSRTSIKFGLVILSLFRLSGSRKKIRNLIFTACLLWYQIYWMSESSEKNDYRLHIYQLSVVISNLWTVCVGWKKTLQTSYLQIVCCDIKFIYCLNRVKRHSCKQGRENVLKKLIISHHCTLSDRFIGFASVVDNLAAFTSENTIIVFK